MEQIIDSDLCKYGINTEHNIMDNGERRFRLIGEDGSSYIRTEATSGSGWQNSHYHATLRELFLVQRGWVVFVELIDGEIVVKKYGANDYFFSRPMIPHNMYMSPETVTHTIKYGDCSQKDWIASEQLDYMIQEIDIDAFVR